LSKPKLTKSCRADKEEEDVQIPCIKEIMTTTTMMMMMIIIIITLIIIIIIIIAYHLRILKKKAVCLISVA
jgi:hypothetical protein